MKKNILGYFTRSEWVLVMTVAFGYFVDLYDLYLFISVRTSSLLDLGVPQKMLVPIGINLFNWQLAGMLVGGILWGTLADKKGRLSILFGSIITYSLANIANAFVGSVEWYSFWRFITGLGLAGELGVGITLVSENLPNYKRTIATTIISSIGLLGTVVSALVASKIDWRYSFVVGGVIGLILLFVRYRVKESQLFKEVSLLEVKKGDLFHLLKNKKMALRFLWCILAGAPVLVFTGIFIGYSPEFANLMGVTTPIKATVAVPICFLALATADVIGGLMSKKFRSRKTVLIIFALYQILATAIFLYIPGTSAIWFYTKCALIGIGIGYWGVLVTHCAENIGTNYRATITTSMTNFIRAFGIPGGILFKIFTVHMGMITAGAIVIALFSGLSLLGILMLPDKFENNLSFIDLKHDNQDTGQD